MYYRRVFTCEERGTNLSHPMHQDGQSFVSDAKNDGTARQPILRETEAMCSEEEPATLASKSFQQVKKSLGLECSHILNGPVTEFD